MNIYTYGKMGDSIKSISWQYISTLLGKLRDEIEKTQNFAVLEKNQAFKSF